MIIPFISSLTNLRKNGNSPPRALTPKQKLKSPLNHSHVRMEIARRGHCIASPSLSSGRKGERQMNAMQNKYAKEVNL